MALVGVKIIFGGVFLFPVFFLHFSYVFPQKFTHFFDGWRSAILYVGPVALLVPFILLLQVDIGRVLKIGSIFYYVFTFKGPLESHLLALVLSLVGLGYFSWGVVNFIVSYRQTKITRQRLQILYLLVGIISMFVIGLVLHLANYLFDLGYAIGREVRLVAVCVDKRETANRIVDLVRADFPGMKLYVRAYDRRHTLELVAKGVDFELRETFELAVEFGRAALEGLGLSHERAVEVADYVRTRDLERLALQRAEGLAAGRDLAFRPRVEPEPLSEPTRKTEALNAEAAELVREDHAAGAVSKERAK